MTGNPPSRGTLPVLVNLTTNERYTLSGPSVSLGRAPENEVILPDDGYASASHARIFWDQGRWWLEDLMSSNGTTVNDQLITGPWQLAPGNVIKVDVQISALNKEQEGLLAIVRVLVLRIACCRGRGSRWRRV